MAVLARPFFERDALEVAPDLLNKVLHAGDVSGRIVEVEAYRADDPASHAFRGRTARNASMFAAGGTLYVYLSYGIHHCANVVTGFVGDGQAVLIRSVEVLSGHAAVAARRPGRAGHEWANGPGKVCAALAIDRTHDGTDLCRDSWLWIGDDGTSPPDQPLTTPRIGISVAVEVPWRFCDPP